MENDKVPVSFRLSRNSKGLLFLRLGSGKSLRFGDIYQFNYTPSGSKLSFNEQLSKLPFYDKTPLIVFLEYRPENRTIMGLNLHLLDPFYRNNVILLIDYIKELLHLKVQEGKSLEPEDEANIENIFDDDVDPIESIEETEGKMVDEKMEDALADSERLLNGQKAIDWDVLKSINNPLTNMFPICFRIYSIKRMKNVEDLYELNEDEKTDLILDTPNLHGKIRWSVTDIKKISGLSKKRKDWRNYIRKKVEKKRKEKKK